MIPHRASAEQDAQFKRIFGTGTHRFVNPFTGFDVIAFDDFVNTPHNVSTSEHVRSVYGEDAERLVRALLRA